MINNLELSIVSPVYNEGKNILEFLNRLEISIKKLKINYEIILIDDGSEDYTKNIIKSICEKNKNIKSIFLSRNFSHQKALLCGLDHASGNFIISLDSDLQDPPELLEKIYNKLKREKYEIVNTKRISRDGESFLKLILINFFYILSSIFLAKDIKYQVGDYRGITKKALDEALKFRKNFFYRAVVSKIGFKQYVLEYNREKRFEGSSKVNFVNLLSFAIDGIFSSSFAPLTMIFYFLMLALFSLLIFFYFQNLFLLTIFLGLICTINILGILIIGYYIKNLHSNEKTIYIVDKKINFN